MKIIDKYILKKVLSTYFFVVLILVAVIVVIDIAEKMDKFLSNHLNSTAILGYYIDFAPWVAGLITPITVFIAIVYVTSRMAAHTEIVAILGSGVSFRRLLLPYFLASLFVGVVSFILNGWVIPHSNRNRLQFETQYFNNRYYFDKRNVHMQVSPNVYMFMQNFNNQSATGYQFTLEKFDHNRLIEKMSADNIQWDSVKKKWTLRAWKLSQVDEIFDDTRTTPATVTTSGAERDTTLTITPKDFENEERKFDGMTISELHQYIEKLKFRGSTGVEAYEVEYQIRFSSPFTIFVLVFMGVIVSARKSRGGTGFQIALGFMLSFVFILFFMMARTFAEAGSLPPLLAAWLPNIIFGVISAFMFNYVPR